VSNRNQIEQQIITSKFVNEWVPRFPQIPVKYENRNFGPPINAPWAAFAIRSGKVAEAAISTIMPRGIGETELKAFVPENAGTILARQMTDRFADVFDNWHYVYPATTNYPRGDFWFKRVEVVQPPSQREGWMEWTATVEFKHDEQIVIAQTGSGGAPTPGQMMWGETPEGAIDGANRTFVSAYPFKAGCLAVYLNGIRQRAMNDYAELDTITFQFVSAPLPGDSLSIDYVQP
jgi:hypothetical protein